MTLCVCVCVCELFADLSLAADGCDGADGVHANFSFMLQYPEAIWTALNHSANPDVYANLQPALTSQIQRVDFGVSLKGVTANNPSFSLGAILAQDPTNLVNMNISGLMAWTGGSG